MDIHFLDHVIKYEKRQPVQLHTVCPPLQVAGYESYPSCPIVHLSPWESVDRRKNWVIINSP